MAGKRGSEGDRLDKIVADARRAREERGHGYREQALKLYPWVCGRCAREFSRETLHELTVHHRDHDHANNPADGSNWELLCLYCHDNEHRRLVDGEGRGAKEDAAGESATDTPFADLRRLLDEDANEDP